MKKHIFTLVLTLTTLVATSYGSTDPIKRQVPIKESSIQWTGKKITGSHQGTLALKEGYLEMDGDQLIGGTFVVDMTTLTVTDLEGDNKTKLEEHLTSDDFFGIATYPTATFEITQVVPSGAGYSVVGNLTIKGKTLPTKIKMNLDNGVATTTFDIDRTKYDIRYGSASFFDNLKDNAIYDDFQLEVKLIY